MRASRIFAVMVMSPSIAVLVPMGGGVVHAAVAPSLAIEPTTGPAGTNIHVTGTGCPDPSWDTSLTWTVHVQIETQGSTSRAGTVTQPSGTPTTPIAFPAIGYPGVAVASATPAADGTWSADITIPGDGAFAAGPGSYPIGALCYATEGAEAGTIDYAGETFVVPPTTTPIVPTPIGASPSLTG
jgi:hypothetical protein